MESSRQSASHGLEAGRSQATIMSALTLLIGITQLFVLFVGILRILDAASEQKVAEAVQRLSQGKTALIGTHQLATVSDADLIVVLSAGRIVESGSHGELLEIGDLYKRFWETQQGEAPHL